MTNALNQTTTFGYDNNGNQTSILDANNHLTQFVYDELGRRTSTVYPDTTTDLTGYDAVGRVTSKTDQAGKVTQYGYDSLGRLTSVTQSPDGGTTQFVTSYGYDELGNRITQTDANNHTTSYAYDQLGRRVKRTLPLGQFETYAYDNNGNLQSRTDFNGHTTTYAYDNLNRLLSKTADPFFSAGACSGGVCGATQVSFTYNALGQRQSMTDASGTTTYTYDNNNRLSHKVTPEGGLNYTYDNVGDVGEVYADNWASGGVDTSYSYDALNRMSKVTANSDYGPIVNTVTNYTYDPVGNLATVAYPNGVTHTYTYNTLNRLTNLSVSCGTAAPGCGPNSATYAYTLGPAGNRIAVSELSGRNVTYGYDDLYRLTSETISGSASQNGAIGYQYDHVGNRLQLTSTVPAIPAGTLFYDANDRLSTDTYDSDGNTVSSGGIGNVYDFENHLVQHGLISIVYDGDGNRVAKTIGGATTKYLVDTNNPTGYAQVLEELSGTAVQRKYTYGLSLISENQNIGSTQTVSFYGFDGHGNVRQITSSTGAVTDTYTYDAFGNILSTTGSTPNNYKFAGEQFDPDLGLYYNRARYLDVRQGRFWGMDTYGGDDESPISLHKYLYAGINPVNTLDPSGRDFIETISAIGNQAILFAMSNPLLTNTALAVLLALAPEEFVNGLPPSFNPEIAIAPLVESEVSELNNVKRLYNSGALGRAGRLFEDWMINSILRGVEKDTQVVVKDGAQILSGARVYGSAVLDAVIRGIPTEFKSSAGALRKEQTIQFVKYAANLPGQAIEFVFLHKPSPSEIEALKDVVREGSRDVRLHISYILGY